MLNIHWCIDIFFCYRKNPPQFSRRKIKCIRLKEGNAIFLIVYLLNTLGLGEISIHKTSIFTSYWGFQYLLVISHISIKSKVQFCTERPEKLTLLTFTQTYKSLVHNKYSPHLMKRGLYIFNTHLKNQLTLALLNKLNRK